MTVSVCTGLPEAVKESAVVGVEEDHDSGDNAIITVTLPVNRGVWSPDGGDLRSFAKVLVSFSVEEAKELLEKLPELIREAQAKNFELATKPKPED